MHLSAFSIFDRKGQSFAVPFFFPSIPQGIRAFKATAQDTNTLMNKFPEDFELYHLGTYDDTTGHLDNLDKPVYLCNALHTLGEPTKLQAVKETNA